MCVYLFLHIAIHSFGSVLGSSLPEGAGERFVGTGAVLNDVFHIDGVVFPVGGGDVEAHGL